MKDARLSRTAQPDRGSNRLIKREDLSPWTAEIFGVLLPRLDVPLVRPAGLISTPTTVRNGRLLAEALKSAGSILLTGLSGSGKTSLIVDAAREMGAEKSMLTLHLNEQTDAKLLIGMYTTGTVPGSFTWQPGVLSTAAREGRWVIIEDLDRAPTDVIAVIMPLLSERALMVPSQGETIRASAGFKLVATMRTSIGSRGENIKPSSAMLGNHLWRLVEIEMPALEEYEMIITSMFPLLHMYIPRILKVYGRIRALYHDQASTARNRILLGRSVTPRDLLRWCRRINHAFTSAGLQTGLEALSEGANRDIFAEAVNCFAVYQQNDQARRAILSIIGEEMQVSPQQVDHFSGYIPSYSDSGHSIRIGRVRLSKHRTAGGLKAPDSARNMRPFVATKQSLRLLEQIGAAVRQSEPVLLVGETGTGKTALIQRFAETLGYKLTVLNLSQQSETGDILGGFKPVNIRNVVMPMKEDFDSLFDSTFSLNKNQRYLGMLGKCIVKEQWNRVLTLWKEALDRVTNALGTDSPKDGADHPSKKRKMERSKRDILGARWNKFRADLKTMEVLLSSGNKGFAFKFMEGSIIRAARNGEWVLLDEINLAPPDTLESLACLFSDGLNGSRSIVLSDAGKIEQVEAHPDLRIFGAMNPATDVGKRDLPSGLRSRFCEVFVESPDQELGDLIQVVKAWLGDFAAKDDKMALDLARLYLETKKLERESRLVDSTNQRPHFSLRTLTRTLSYIADIAPIYGSRRAMYEGFSMSFLTSLNKESEQLLQPLIKRYVFGDQRNINSLLQQRPRLPGDSLQYVQFESYWIRRGDFPIQEQPEYVITTSVRRNLLNLIRAVSTSRFPVLIQGPTSSGKTSLIAYVAKLTGHKLVRINNHEHTDLQEYLGTYSSDASGQLRFQEGLLVQALRQGHWIILDELNLAPTDVLEALNRLLDDNRELRIPETQEVVRPHPHFMLLATQNPPGLYGGRKYLSRAFRNRFIELHFDEIPEGELQRILQERTQIAPSHSTRVVAVYKELSLLRQTDRLFEQRSSFVTLRDLFRWAQRSAEDRDQLALHGFMLIAERIRKPEEKVLVKRIIEREFKVEIKEESLYSPDMTTKQKYATTNGSVKGIVWTKTMRRLYLLASQALANNEPVLLVGETGCGKTSLCQLLAATYGRKLNIVNAHQNTEAGDLLGALRPLRNRSLIEHQLTQDLVLVFENLGYDQAPGDGNVEALQKAFAELNSAQLETIPTSMKERIRCNEVRYRTLFEWSDGALVRAMKSGEFFLLDEISLADDSVLERLNSLLEPDRKILLAEKGPHDSTVNAAEGFQFLATMNPGGDFGKRELSPALRNRFTEIWVPPVSDQEDLLQIVSTKLSSTMKQFSRTIAQFAQWFTENFRSSPTPSISIRDVLAWVDFINCSGFPDPYCALLHGAALVFIDTLGANPAALIATFPDEIARERRRCLEYLSELLNYDVVSIYFRPIDISDTETQLILGPISIEKFGVPAQSGDFTFHAPTTKVNAMRVIRALQLQKPILLEGSPGVGKTTLVVALAKAIGKRLTRINLSEQTDLVDLFGSDVPAEGAEAGKFIWREGPFLQAMQNGDWVLLDEMNLASQSVLEGLNSCLDHRGEIYVSELDRTFTRHAQFTVFATQNPHHQGGGRKGLPTSFVNRFSVVFADELSSEDLMLVCTTYFPTYPRSELQGLLDFITTVDKQTRRQGYASHGGPWEFNLRDISRWLQLLTSTDLLLSGRKAVDYFGIIVSQRFRTQSDRDRASSLFQTLLGEPKSARHISQNLGARFYQVGLGLLLRLENAQPISVPSPTNLNSQHLSVMESLMICVHKRWPSILVGPSGSGKSGLIKYLASVAGTNVIEYALNPDVDAMDLIGSYEQTDPQRKTRLYIENLRAFIQDQILSHANSELIPQEVLTIIDYLHSPSMARQYLATMSECLAALSKQSPSLELSGYIRDCNELLSQSEQVDKARFEWVDGILVRALQQGAWLILRDANLCSSSVLDRLNSLLEPSGQLGINERGEETALVPHPNFRIFLTMDPRQGELSRAMRNRSVEIFMEVDDSNVDLIVHAPPMVTAYESLTSRLRSLTKVLSHSSSSTFSRQLVETSLMRLSWADLDMLDIWHREANAGLISLSYSHSSILAVAVEKFMRLRRENFTEEIFSMLKLPLPIMSRGFIEEQVIDPLLNPILRPIPGTPCAHLNPYHMASILDLILESLSMEQRLLPLAEHSQASNAPGTLMPNGRHSSLDLRGIRSRSSSVLQFLREVCQQLQGWLLAYWSSYAMDNRGQMVPSQAIKANQQIIESLKNVILHWHSTFDVALSPRFQEATLQMHIRLWNTLVANCKDASWSYQHLLKMIRPSLRLLESSWRLSTGLSMERLWAAFRPVTPSNLQQLQTLLQLEYLASRFQAADLQHAIDTLENTSGVIDPWESAYFQSEFEGLCQCYDLQEPRNSKAQEDFNSLVPFLAKRPTSWVTSFRRLTCYDSKRQPGNNGPFVLFSDLLAYSGYGRVESMRLLGLGFKVPISIISKIQTAKDVTLGKLDLLHLETQCLGRNVARSTEVLSKNQLAYVSEYLLRMLEMVFSAHADICSETQRVWFQRATSLSRTSSGLFSAKASLGFFPPFEDALLNNKHFQDIAEKYLVLSIYLLHDGLPELNSIPQLAQAWILSTLGCLLLYVPNIPFDPALKLSIEEEMRKRQKQNLVAKLSTSRDLEETLSGQFTNPRCEMLDEELQSLGNEPSGPCITRPEVSELQSLQVEFDNVLASVVKPLQDDLFVKALFSGDAHSRQGLETLLSNISRVMQRISTDYRPYDDITAPLVGMLGCLDLGLSLLSLPNAEASKHATGLVEMTELTPFTGGRPDMLLGAFLEDIDFALIRSPIYRVRYLQWVAIVKNVEGLQVLDRPGRTKLTVIFHEYYTDWKKQLEVDQTADTKKLALYHYRGNEQEADDIDHKELEELFPTFDNESADSHLSISGKSGEAPQERAKRLAVSHSAIFYDIDQAPRQILQLLDTTSIDDLSRYNVSNMSPGPQGMTERLMPRLLMSIHELQRQLLPSSMPASQYDFYSDANLTESRKLVDLASRIYRRFQEISSAWPEHATLQDILATCLELLALKHVDPIARLLSKAEKLHGYMHEWEVVASKQYSAQPLYAELTFLLINWRRLELSTWARLFQQEEEKCRNETRTWWFMAYEIVVAVPMSVIQSGEDLAKHAVDLLLALESFLSTADLGQFSTRLQILAQLKEHVSLMAQDSKPMEVIFKALNNFLGFYSKFEPQIKTALTDGRMSLEKEAKEVVLLASWKDTNIVALRESARRSHYKLLRLVRRYRSLLAEPAANRLKQGLATDTHLDVLCVPSKSSRDLPSVDIAALELCQNSISSWSKRPSRFTDITSTVSRMSHTVHVSSILNETIEYLESFGSDLVASVKELRSQTPAVMSKENEKSIKHLTARKRKLFGDTLKELRRMGVKRNFGTTELAVQSSAAIIMASTESGSTSMRFDCGDIDHYFHPLLDVMPKVRQAMNGHSQDLSAMEITRSIGYFEGLLYVLLRQRQFLAISLHHLSALEDISKMLSRLWSPESYGLQSRAAGSRAEFEGLRRTILWLPNILEVASSILEVHTKLGEMECPVIAEALHFAKLRFEIIAKEWKSLPVLPNKITTTLHIKVYEAAKSYLTELQGMLRKMAEEEPLFAYLFKQVLLWTEPLLPALSEHCNGSESSEQEFKLRALDEQISKTCDMILTALQNAQHVVQNFSFSVTDSNWMVDYNKQIPAILRELGAPRVTLELRSAMDHLSHLDISNEDDLQAASALFAVALPIVQMYSAIYQEAVQNYSALHRSLSKLTYILAVNFTQLASQGFCTPAEQSKAEDGETQKMEDGTGLGEGEGVNSISHDIKDGEELTDIAQESNRNTEKQELENDEDAVEMADDMDGQTDAASQVEENSDGSVSGESEDNEMDEKADDVDDLDPTAVDEKFWNGDGDDAEKDQRGDNSKGKATGDEHVATTDAAEQNNGKEDETQDKNDHDEVGADEDDEVRFDGGENQDPHVQEGNALDLPEDIDFDNDKRSDDLDSDNMSQMIDEEDEALSEGDVDGKDIASAVDTDDDPEANKAGGSDGGPNEDVEMEDANPETASVRDEIEEADQEPPLPDHDNSTSAGAENTVPSDVRGAGNGQGQVDNDQEPSSQNNAQGDEGRETTGQNANVSEATAIEKNPSQMYPGLQQHEAREGKDEQSQQTPSAQAFKKLGDVLERWHRQQEQIREATEHQENSAGQKHQGAGVSEFEHVQNDDDAADTQALGAATDEQAHALDETMAMDTAGSSKPDNVMAEGVKEEEAVNAREDMDVDEEIVRPDAALLSEEQRNSGATIGEQRPLMNEPSTNHKEDMQDDDEEEEEEEDVANVDSHLSAIQLSSSSPPSSLRSATNAQALWTQYEMLTRPLSLILTEQLRLILNPTVATKMRGDFRTGKRLNMKRIIPYIASQYKRDKIWMRRSAPSKHAYQIMLAVDDSKSMGENGAGSLALQTLVMVSRSLTMLEAGQMCIVAFGEDVRVAHDFESSSSFLPASIFQHFTFQQTRTDVRALVSQSLDLFRSARLSPSSSSNAAADLWQLQLIVSDGICEDHDAIRRLVRQAQEERIMIVFIIVDVIGQSKKGAAGAGTTSSILEMSRAKFERDHDPSAGAGGMKVTMQRYLDTFPFPFYLVVGDVKDLPAVLANALRQWFRGVVDAGAA
ncbi:MAG: hypothetical protein M1816_004352 [Peltula sp. TS41687]|nr:MAG: hypothetical protein M1816_004352 [Peltula sp. TS41687]